MAEKTIGFIGLGLIGGSIAKVLHRKHPRYRLIAYNRTKASLIAALADGVINEATDTIDAAFSECDYVFLCLPVSLNIQLLPRIAAIVPEECIITDVGSVKSTIHEAVKQNGLEGRFIGGHPMAGSEKTGYGASSDRLLENAYYMITPTAFTKQEKIDDYVQLAKDMDAIPMVLDYREHDRATAAISHLPHVLAYALVNQVQTSDNQDGLMRKIAAGGFRDITRIASSSPDMWESICLENKDQLCAAIASYADLLMKIRAHILDERGDVLHAFFESSKNYRDDMPTKTKGAMDPVYEVYVDLIDESGAIATIATILALNSISIKNIGIVHNREFQEGALRIEFYDDDATRKATSLLAKFNYTIYERH